MRYNVSQLLMESTGAVRNYQLDESFAGLQSGQDRAIGTVKILRTHQGVLVTVSIETVVRTSCSRCLVEFKRLSSLTLEEESFPTVDPGTGKKMFPPDESEGVIHIDDRHILDLSDVIRQYVLTDIPIKPLCGNNCLGLCAECGTNLNKEKCKCDTTPADPRWGALLGLSVEGQD